MRSDATFVPALRDEYLRVFFRKGPKVVTLKIKMVTALKEALGTVMDRDNMDMGKEDDRWVCKEHSPCN